MDGLQKNQGQFFDTSLGFLGSKKGFCSLCIFTPFVKNYICINFSMPILSKLHGPVFPCTYKTNSHGVYMYVAIGISEEKQDRYQIDRRTLQCHHVLPIAILLGNSAIQTNYISPHAKRYELWCTNPTLLLKTNASWWNTILFKWFQLLQVRLIAKFVSWEQSLTIFQLNLAKM